MNEKDIIERLQGKKVPHLVNPLAEGLSSEEVSWFLGSLPKANTSQIKAMLTTLQGELKRRELLVPNSEVAK